MLPIKGLRPMHLTPMAEESLCEAGQAQPSGRAGVSQALWALGYLLPWSPQHSFGVAWMLLPLCLSAKTSRMWNGGLPVCCWMLFFRHQSLLPASHGSFSSCHNNHGSQLWAPEPRDQTIFPTPGSLGPLCNLSLSPDVQTETKSFWEPYEALALGRDSSLCLS